MDTMPGCSYDSLKDLNTRISHSHSKKVIKHALRQQAKRRRNSTTIASSGALPRIVVTSLPPQIEAPTKASTMREVLASLPGFSVKPRRRSSKKLSAAAQLEQTKEGCIDLETPDSILVNTNLRAFLNKHTFSSLPSLYQYKLIQLLPGVDRQSATHADAAIRLSGSGLNNEFFARACHEWRERLAEGEFTPENQQKLKAEAEKEMSRLDPWKLKHFEPIWGDKSSPPPDHAPFLLTRPPLKTTIKLRQAPSRHPSKPVPRRLRTVGAVTRAITSYREEVAGAGAEKRGVDDLDDECHKKLKVTQESSVCAQVESGEERVIEIPDGQSECLDGELRSAASQEDNNNVELAFECIDKPASIPDCAPEDVSEDLCHRPEDEVTTYTGAECVDEQASVKTDAPAVEDEPGRVHDVEVIEVITKEDNDEEMDGCELTAENYYVTAASDVSEQCQDYNETQDYNEAFQGESDCYVEISDCVADKQCNDEPNVETIVDNNIQDLVVTEVEFKDDCYAYNCVEKEEEEVSLVKDPSNERREEELSEAISPAKMDVGTSYEQEQDDLNVSFKSEGTDPDHMAYEPNVEHKDDVIHESAILTTTQFLLEEDECKLETEEDPLKQVDEDDYEVVDEGDDYDEPLYVPGDTWDTADSDKLPGEHVDVEVIPMQEELEVRLEEGTFPVAEEALSMDWPYTVKMSPEGGSGLTLNEEENKTTSQAQYPEYSTSQGVKLELEVTLTPEAVSGAESLVTSTVGGGPYYSTPPTVSKASAVAVIPPTTIVCLPSAVSAPSLLHRQSPPMASNVVSAAGMAKTAVVASSSAVPYLAVNSTTPIRALPAQMPKSQAKPKSARDNPQVSTGATNRNSRSVASKPPPGAVNLERSYQICQAVIQNSPNRDQLRCQLKPPPSLLTPGPSKRLEGRPTQYGVVTSSRGGSAKPFTPPLGGVRPGGFHQRQPSPPVVVRHMFTSQQGIPVTMAVLPQAPPTTEMVDSPGPQMGQYILVQRTGVSDQPTFYKGAPPRASSAPPSHHQQQVAAGRGRPASVDAEHYVMHCPNPGTQAITRRDVPYGGVGSEAVAQSYTLVGGGESQTVMEGGGGPPRNSTGAAMAQSEASPCACNLNAMIMCKKCGAFCHDDCISPARLCYTCLIR